MWLFPAAKSPFSARNCLRIATKRLRIDGAINRNLETHCRSLLLLSSTPDYGRSTVLKKKGWDVLQQKMAPLRSTHFIEISALADFHSMEYCNWNMWVVRRGAGMSNNILCFVCTRHLTNHTIIFQPYNGHYNFTSFNLPTSVVCESDKTSKVWRSETVILAGKLLKEG